MIPVPTATEIFLVLNETEVHSLQNKTRSTPQNFLYVNFILFVSLLHVY